MITITRLLARQVKTIARHLFGAKKYALPAVQVTAGTEGLRLAACDGERGFEYRESVPHSEGQLRAPLELFRELAATIPHATRNEMFACLRVSATLRLAVRMAAEVLASTQGGGACLGCGLS